MNFYPNPFSGNGTLKLHMNLTEVSDVKVVFLTTSYRKVKEQVFRHVAVGEDLKMEPVDQAGISLANGLYYIRVAINGHSFMNKTLKILILR